MIYNTESESTVCLENNQLIAQTGDIMRTEATSNAALLVEIQKLRSELIATNEENKRNQKEAVKELESKMENIKKDNKNNLNELSEKLQSIESMTSQIFKTNVNPEKSDVSSLKSVKQLRLKHVFTDATNFVENANNLSEKEDHYNVNWYMCVNRNENHLGFYVFCEPIAPKGEWSIRAKLEFKVASINQDVVIRTCKSTYQKHTGWGFPKYIDWEEMKQWYLVSGNLSVEAKVTIIETTGLGKEKLRKFDESQKDFSDVILVVRDTKFYVLKMFLAAQSSIFKALLLGNFSESKQLEVTLNGIDPDDFHYFLEVLYGESAIDDTNVEDVALLADMYDAPTAIRKCEEFLIEKSKKTLEKKLEIAIRYNLERLKPLE
ncbi:hypothetical protein B9Z55_007713 [Caenorhabditis nigoni]|nr:hypothetical protein B9Z55_007713 [Caenorhabditis nigoni]